MSFFTLRRQMDDLMNQMLTPVLYDPFFSTGYSDLPLLGTGNVDNTSGRNENDNTNTMQTDVSSSSSATPSSGGTQLTPTVQGQAQLSTLSPQLIRCDVHEEKDKFCVEAEIPGVPKENIKVRVDNGYLTISGEKKEEKLDEKNEGNRQIRRSERRYGSFSRSFRLPAECEADKIQAKFNNSVLCLDIPKTEKAKAQTQEITIQ